MVNNMKIIFKNILLILSIFLSFTIVYAYPSNIIVLFQDKEYYLVEAEENEIPEGFVKDKLDGFGLVVEAYKNGPLKMIKISDEDYNYQFVAVDEKNNYKSYYLHKMKLEKEIYYIIPYQIEEYKSSSYNLSPYKTFIKDQIMTCYSSEKYGYEKLIVYGINNKGELALLSYENDEYVFLEKSNKDCENILPIIIGIIVISLIFTLVIIIKIRRKKNEKTV